MSVLARLFERRGLTTQAIFSRDLDLLPARNESGIHVSQRNALNDTAIWAAVTLLAGDISGLPAKAYREIGDIRQPLSSQPVWIQRPDPLDPTITWPVHIASAAISMLLDGSLFVLVEPDVFNPERLQVLNPTVVHVRKSGRIPMYDIRAADRNDSLTAANILHAPLFMRPGEDRGISPIDEHAEAIGLSRAAEKYSAKFFGSGATMSGIVEVPPTAGEYTEDDIKSLREQFSKTHGGWRKSYALGVLTGGAKWVPTSANPKDSQLIELRAYQVEEAARIYKIPPYMLGSQQPGAVAYASVEQAAINYVTHTLAHYLAPLEAAYSRLVPGDSRLSVPGSNTYFKFNVNGLLRGDATARANFYKAMWGVGALSPDDIRRFEDQPPIADGRGSQYFSPINYAPMEPPSEEPPEDEPLAVAGTAA
jgi:HK97 family phage portal protein